MFLWGCDDITSSLFFQGIHYRVTLNIMPKYSVMEGLGGCAVEVITTENLGFAWDDFLLSLSLSSSLTRSSFFLPHHPNLIT